jgi:tRNA-(ms[2]io[6]A)-hydroxylase
MEIDNKRVLGLDLATDPRWVNLAEFSLQEILTDHAYCEQKAALSCISLIQKYSEFPKLVEDLAPIVTEDWGHFRMVLKELKKRNLILGKQRKDEYVNLLQAFIRKGAGYKEQLTDRLIVCAMIEARSCERFRLLSLHLNVTDLREFYHQFMVAEAAHYRLFLKLSEELAGENQTENRWSDCIKFESELINNLCLRGDRIH